MRRVGHRVELFGKDMAGNARGSNRYSGWREIVEDLCSNGA